MILHILHICAHIDIVKYVLHHGTRPSVWSDWPASSSCSSIRAPSSLSPLWVFRFRPPPPWVGWIHWTIIHMRPKSGASFRMPEAVNGSKAWPISTTFAYNMCICKGSWPQWRLMTAPHFDSMHSKVTIKLISRGR